MFIVFISWRINQVSKTIVPKLSLSNVSWSQPLSNKVKLESDAKVYIYTFKYNRYISIRVCVWIRTGWDYWILQQEEYCSMGVSRTQIDIGEPPKIEKSKKKEAGTCAWKLQDRQHIEIILFNLYSLYCFLIFSWIVSFCYICYDWNWQIFIVIYIYLVLYFNLIMDLFFFVIYIIIEIGKQLLLEVAWKS